MPDTVEDLLGPEQTVEGMLGPEYASESTIPRDALERAAQNYLSNQQFQKETGIPLSAAQGTPADFDKPLVHLVPELTEDELAGLRQASAEQQRSAGALNAVAKSVNSLTSQNNLSLLAATMGLGAAPALGRGVALGFAGYMGKNAIGAAHELAKELQKPEADRDQEKIGSLLAEGGINTFMAGLGAHGGLKGEAVAPAERVSGQLDKQVRRADLGDVEAAAVRGGRPTVEALLGPEEPAVQTSARPEKPTVPETPAEQYQSGVEEIRTAGAQTIRQIQELWPKASLSREEARIWRDLAWPSNRETGTPSAAAETPANLLTSEVGESAPAAPAPEVVREPAPEVPKADVRGAIEAPEDLRAQLDAELGQTEPVKPGEKLDSPREAAAKVEEHVVDVAQSNGERPANDIKDELVAKLQKAIAKAPAMDQVLEGQTAEGWSKGAKKYKGPRPLAAVYRGEYEVESAGAVAAQVAKSLEASSAKKITIDIPGDGRFKVWNLKDTLQDVLDRAQKVKTDAGKAARAKSGMPAPNALNRPGLLFTEEEWLDPSTLGKLQSELKKPDVSAGRRMALETALRQARQLQGIETPAEVTHSMATGGAPPLRTTAPPAPRPPPAAGSLVPSAPLPAPKVNPIRARLTAIRTGLQTIFSPQNIDPSAKAFSHILRENNAQAALDMVRADEHLGELRGFFDRTPVPKDWAYDPAQPLPHNYAVIDALERNRAALPQRLQDLAQAFDAEFAWRVAEVQKIKPNALQSLIQDYFPHLWERPDSPTTKALMQEVAAKSPFHGSGGFLKQRSVPVFMDGLVRGLRPISDNPIDLLLAKMHQMDKFLMAAKTMQEAKANGMLKYYPLGRRMEPGRTVVDDPAFTVYAPPVLEVQEAFDAGVRRGLMDFIGKMGFRHERVAKLGVNQWGQYTTGRGEIKSRFGGPDFVIMHEIGHGLEERYGLSRYLLSNSTLQKEMSDLANLRVNGAAPKKFRKYIQTPDEQVANAIHGYIYAPDEMARTAPNVQKVIQNIIRQHPELQDLNDIKPGFAVGTGKVALQLVGPQLAGHWTLPDGPAAVLSNYLSPGLSRWAPYRTLRAGSNILNAAQLGLSGFHVGFTSLDAVVSSVATGLGYLARGDVGKAGKSFAFAPFAPAANYYVGKAVQAKMVNPAATHVPVMDFPRLGLGWNVKLSPAADVLTKQIAELAVKGGLRAEVDPFWKTNITRNLVRAWHEGGVKNYAKVGLQAPLALIEQSMRPIAEYLVPRQKLGVFAQLALQEMDRMGAGASNEQVRAGMARASDATEDRMGQMTYDNLFYNKVVKDAALLGFRAYGWQLGKYRHLYGAASDAATLAKGVVTGGKVEVTNRMLYPVALTMVAATVGAVVHRMLTGQNPENRQDYLFPRTGRLDKDGRAERLALPTYMKDLAGDWKDFPDYQKMGANFYHKLNPSIAATVDMWRNQDYYGVEIRHPDDPVVRQMGDLGAFALKQFTPFSISGTMKLAEDQAPIAQLVLPFIGVVPAKKSLLMSPAETLSADITRASMDVGGRTREQFDHSQVLKMIVQDIRKNGVGSGKLTTAVDAGQLRPGDEHALSSMLNTTPLQYQVGRMSPGDAMRVWRLANAAERQQLGAAVASKVANSKVLEDGKRTAYLQELVKTGLSASKVASGRVQ